jgi:L-threonylcarbamoyladenylate synthase
MNSQVEQAISILKAGGIVAFPTDTVYGLGADIYNIEAVERIFEVKQRSRNTALPVLLGEAEQISEVAVSIPDIAKLYIRRFWPGGLTLVVPKAVSIPPIITAGGDKVAVRLPDHNIPRALINGLGAPIIGTSANISSKPAPVTAEQVMQQLGGQVDFVIRAGRCMGGVGSTVVDISGERPVVLREGIIPTVVIEKLWRETLKEANNSAHCCGK